MKRIVLGVAIALAINRIKTQDKISIFGMTVVELENFQPIIPHPEQEKVPDQKLKDLENMIGKKPNILIFLVDDLGWGDIGLNGGRGAVGGPTPNTNLGLGINEFFSLGKWNGGLKDHGYRLSSSHQFL